MVLEQGKDETLDINIDAIQIETETVATVAARINATVAMEKFLWQL